jgi:hypothetical protein
VTAAYEESQRSDGEEQKAQNTEVPGDGTVRSDPATVLTVPVGRDECHAANLERRNGDREPDIEDRDTSQQRRDQAGPPRLWVHASKIALHDRAIVTRRAYPQLRPPE